MLLENKVGNTIRQIGRLSNNGRNTQKEKQQLTTCIHVYTCTHIFYTYFGERYSSLSLHFTGNLCILVYESGLFIKHAFHKQSTNKLKWLLHRKQELYIQVLSLTTRTGLETNKTKIKEKTILIQTLRTKCSRLHIRSSPLNTHK